MSKANEFTFQNDMIQQLVQDRERYEGEAEAANQKYYTALEEVKLQELQISALKAWS